MDAILSLPWWILLFFVVGVIAVFGSILTLFFEVGGRPADMEATECPEVGDPNFIAAIAGAANAPTMKGGRAELLNNGDEAFPVMLEAVRNARKTVNWMVYIWKDGRASDLVLDALTERARAGVEVRLLLDGLGGKDAPDDKLKTFEEAGGHVSWFRKPQFGKLTRMHKRNHRRAIVIDGRVAFTGGMAVADEWLGDARNPDEWRDCMVKLTGCLAPNLQSAFAQLWTETTGEMLVGEEFYPQDPPGEDGDGEPGKDEISHHLPVISSPSDENHLLRKPFWLSLRCARERIWITTPYFVPDPSIREVLKDQARAGIDVRVLVPNEHIDLPPIRWAAQYYYEEMLEAGVRIWEYQPTMIHAKLLVVDGRWSIVGSANSGCAVRGAERGGDPGDTRPRVRQDVGARPFSGIWKARRRSSWRSGSSEAGWSRAQVPRLQGSRGTVLMLARRAGFVVARNGTCDLSQHRSPPHQGPTPICQTPIPSGTRTQSSTSFMSRRSRMPRATESEISPG